MSKIYRVDIPHMYRKDEFYNVATLDTREEAIQFCKDNYGADDKGCICLVSEGQAVEED